MTIKELRNGAVIATSMLLALGVACSAPPTPLPSEKTKICDPGCVTPTPQPELGGLPLYDSGTIRYSGHVYDNEGKLQPVVKEVGWFNVASPDLKLNDSAVAALLSAFEKVGETKSTMTYPIGERTISLNVQPRDAQFSWVLINNEKMTGEQWSSIRDDLVSVVIGAKAQYSTNVPLAPWSDATFGLAKAACDVSLSVRNEEVRDSESLWQDIVCEFLAHAYRWREKKVPYENRFLGVGVDASGYTYQIAASRLSFSENCKYCQNLFPIIFDKATYEKLPEQSIIVTQK